MKGWHKHGICAEECWPYNGAKTDRRLTEERTADALKRPLGAYFRVNHKDLVAMHSSMRKLGFFTPRRSCTKDGNGCRKTG
jgi:hypothetical protein